MARHFSKIDIFCHVLPERYRKALYSKCYRNRFMEDWEGQHNEVPALFDLELRLSMMDRQVGLGQVISIVAPPLEAAVSPNDAIELAKLGNDEIADLVVRHPDHFIAAAACLPMHDMDAALNEAQRAMEELNMKGVQLYTPCNDKPLDSPEFFPLYEMMTKYDLPILLHPTRDGDRPDYKGESGSKYRMFQKIGWPYETTVAMVRLLFAGVLERYPSLKIITHHCGAMVPYFAGRLCLREKSLDEAAGLDAKLSKPTVEYFKMFYGDTAVSSYTPALMCGYAFFGADHIVFGSDSPFGVLEKKISSVEEMAIPESDKYLIFEGNARRLLHLD